MKLVGIDVGGTFTDLVLVDTDRQQTVTHKVPTTTEDPSQGVVRGLVELTDRVGVQRSEIDHVLHGTTVGVNALLTYDGARTGMITTEGYRDIIHIGRHQRPQHYSIMQEIPWQDRPLVRRRYRKVVRERLVFPDGAVEVPLDEEGVRQAVRELREEGVESIVVGFLFSYLNPAHEERAAEIIAEEHPEAFVTTSSGIYPQFREFERFTTAAINGFIGPKVRNYIERLSAALSDAGCTAELHLMRSNAGVATARTAAAQPVTLLLSGPAAGVLGGNWSGDLVDRQRLITFDVGGTSADIGIVTESGITEASARDTWVAGYPVMVPMIDIRAIGAGGGSIAYVDRGGAFRVGPRSAGAEPGPACYGRGGTEPTVTDANVVLGRLDPDHFLGGEMTIHPELAREAVGRLADELGLSLEETAAGIITIANANMANAIREVTIQKGLDPRQFALVALGGAGPLVAAEVAESLEIPEIIVPAHPGITSAVGLLTTDLKYDLIRTEVMFSTAPDLEKLNRDFAALEDQAREQLRADHVADEDITLTRLADCRYLGQGYELRVSVPGGVLSDEALRGLFDEFHKAHQTEYGHCFPDSPVEIVSIRVIGRGAMPKLPLPEGPAATDLRSVGTRSVYFRVDGELQALDTTYYERESLPAGVALPGPCVVFQKDSTIVVPPSWTLTVDATGVIFLRHSK